MAARSSPEERRGSSGQPRCSTSTRSAEVAAMTSANRANRRCHMRPAPARRSAAVQSGESLSSHATLHASTTVPGEESTTSGQPRQGTQSSRGAGQPPNIRGRVVTISRVVNTSCRQPSPSCRPPSPSCRRPLPPSRRAPESCRQDFVCRRHMPRAQSSQSFATIAARLNPFTVHSSMSPKTAFRLATIMESESDRVDSRIETSPKLARVAIPTSPRRPYGDVP